jgi:hypothetical protein
MKVSLITTPVESPSRLALLGAVTAELDVGDRRQKWSCEPHLRRPWWRRSVHHKGDFVSAEEVVVADVRARFIAQTAH